MVTFKERSDQRMFVRKLETVSSDLAAWAQQKFEWDWSLEDVKLALNNAANICGRK
jgi:hypothetical protein